MKIEYRNGNLFKYDARFIVHCCNMQNKMGKGFAKELKKQYPGAFVEYSKKYYTGLTLGEIVPYQSPDGVVIFNLIGQRYYGTDKKKYVSYDALAEGFESLDLIAKDIGMDYLHMPKIGANLAGGNWNIISSIIETYSENYQPIVYIL